MATVTRDAELDRLRSVLDAQRAVNAGPADARRVMSVVIERAQQATGADGAAIEFVEGRQLVRRATRGLSRHAPARPLDLDASLAGLSLGMKMPLVCRDARSDFRVDDGGYREAGIGSVVVAPVVRSGDSVGVLEVLSGRPDHFVPADTDVVELMANLMAPLYEGSSALEAEAERALRDPLTGLANGLIFMDRLTNQVAQTRRYGCPFGLFFIDLDDVTTIDDALGHDWADAVVRAIGQGLHRTVRGGDSLARLGTGRFAILCTNAERDVAEHLLKGRIGAVINAVNDELRLDGFELRASIGTVWSSGDEVSPEQLLADAGASVARARREPAPG
jgi:diguanylate cyclase (GGDEF)-like protein